MAKASEKTKSSSGRNGTRRKNAKSASAESKTKGAPVAVANGNGSNDDLEEVPAGNDGTSTIDAETHAKYEEVKRGDLHIKDLQKLNVDDLHEIAKIEGLTEYTGLKKSELIFKILKERIRQNGLMYGEGVLEILPDGTIVDPTADGHNVYIHEGFKWGYDLRCAPVPGAVVLGVMGFAMLGLVRLRRGRRASSRTHP